jgi:hypothetical protein
MGLERSSSQSETFYQFHCPEQNQMPSSCPHGPSSWHLLAVKIRQPSHEFTFGVGISFIPYPLVLSPVV